MEYNLIDLTPYTPEMLLKNISERIRVLELLNFVFNSSQKALESFIDCNYTNFDAQVSENLCQIRAYQIMNIDSTINKESLFISLKNIKNFRGICQELLENYAFLRLKRPSHYSDSINKKIQLQTFLQDNDLNINISEQVYFIIQSYILSYYKLVGEYDISLGINYEKLCFDLKIDSKSYARKFVHRLQRNLSILSTNFVFKLQKQLLHDGNEMIFMKKLCFKDEVGRQVLPCYEVTKIILNHALKRETYIQIIVFKLNGNEKKLVHFFLKTCPKKNDFILCNTPLEPGRCFIVFKGIAHCDDTNLEIQESYIEHFMQFGLKKIILANMAQHPQYAGILLSDKKNNPYQEGTEMSESLQDKRKCFEANFLFCKNLSKEIGCSQENASLFLLTHVYCSSISMEYTIAVQKTEVHS